MVPSYEGTKVQNCYSYEGTKVRRYEGTKVRTNVTFVRNTYVRVFSEVASRTSEAEQPLGLLPALRQIHFIHSNQGERCNPAYFLSGMLPVSCANPERELELTTRMYVPPKTKYTCRPRSDAPTNMTIGRVAFSSHFTCHCMPR